MTWQGSSCNSQQPATPKQAKCNQQAGGSNLKISGSFTAPNGPHGPHGQAGPRAHQSPHPPRQTPLRELSARPDPRALPEVVRIGRDGPSLGVGALFRARRVTGSTLGRAYPRGPGGRDAKGGPTRPSVLRLSACRGALVGSGSPRHNFGHPRLGHKCSSPVGHKVSSLVLVHPNLTRFAGMAGVATELNPLWP